jgi:hypothetical protein
MSFMDKDQALDDIDLGDFQKLLNKFNLLSNHNTSKLIHI